ncbi:selenocysteine-specific translation elongation factor [Vallitalea okinawensis]|uniref:selenocysteine-specific translation elongation factor n=1 Tax=Vallitalea okinawensis TaxID=2078660 RepID=UPI000CFD2D55|nr:selenocysteine-specific translation elongation factor [Vallitalea okinawensis]
MEHLVIGTAGHVDHGKTELVRALTGVDTDRLKEEQERGMTIELGFAPLMLEDKRASIVDVPGHEKLIKTMVSGASGIDLALLIIDANEGVMPQTIEHLHILSLLNVSSIIVVITKIDMVSNSAYISIKGEINDFLKDTIYKGAAIHGVSSILNIGIEELKDIIIKEVKTLKRTGNQELFRMPIDRVFTIKGHGTIATGTILGGKIQQDDSIEIVDGESSITTRVKSLQVHGQKGEIAFSGQRCAINLNRVGRSQVKRGDVILKPETVEPTGWIETVIYNVAENISIKHNQRVKVNIGTVEVIGQLRIIGENQINSKQKGYACIKLEKSVIAIREDRFIIRSLTPVTTIGGGIVLNHKSSYLSRFKQESIKHFQLLERANIKEIIDYLLRYNQYLYDIDRIYSKLYCNKQDIWKSLKDLAREGKVVRLGKYYVSQDAYVNYIERVTYAFDEHYKRNKYSLFMSKEELKTKYFSELSLKEFQELIQHFIQQKVIYQNEHQLAMGLKERINLVSKETKVVAIEQLILHGGLNGFDLSNFETNQYSLASLSEIFKYLEDMGRVKQINRDLLIHVVNYKEFLNIIECLFKEKKQITVIQVRDALKIGRKRTINLLEYLDEQGITKRIDNYRIRG